MACSFCRRKFTSFHVTKFGFQSLTSLTCFAYTRAKAQMRWPQYLRKLQQARNPLHLCARVRRKSLSAMLLMLTQLP